MLLCFAVLADSADRIGMAASRFLATAAARGILLCFAAENRKSYCSGCIKVANGALAAIFSILALMVFLLPKVNVLTLNPSTLKCSNPKLFNPKIL